MRHSIQTEFGSAADYNERSFADIEASIDYLQSKVKGDASHYNYDPREPEILAKIERLKYERDFLLKVARAKLMSGTSTQVVDTADNIVKMNREYADRMAYYDYQVEHAMDPKPSMRDTGIPTRTYVPRPDKPKTCLERAEEAMLAVGLIGGVAIAAYIYYIENFVP